jgi:hypothetical protein
MKRFAVTGLGNFDFHTAAEKKHLGLPIGVLAVLKY